jgi:hypothetical protein
VKIYDNTSAADPYARGEAWGDMVATVATLPLGGEGVAGVLGKVGAAGLSLFKRAAAADKVVVGVEKLAADFEKEYGVAFFGEDNLNKYYLTDNVSIGAGNGKPFFFMPLEDASLIKNPHDAARYTGMAPSAQRAYLEGSDIYGISFPIEGMEVKMPSASDAAG